MVKSLWNFIVVHLERIGSKINHTFRFLESDSQILPLSGMNYEPLILSTRIFTPFSKKR